MSPILRAASYAAVSFCVLAAAIEAAPSFATAMTPVGPAVEDSSESAPVSSNAESPAIVPQVEAGATVEAESPAPALFQSLSAMVDAEDTGDTLTAEEECLAGAIYFESRSESLEGQHAVADVIINRSESGRFPSSVCGVVRQPGQFSFVRGGKMPAINRASRDWHEAVAIARIAEEDRWESAAPNALFFHAKRVSPRWKLRRVATVGNHVFYR